MAATYAMPSTPSHGGHGHSHSRKSASQRVPLQPASINGGHHMDGRTTEMNSFNPYDHLQKQQPTGSDTFPDLQPSHSHSSHLQLPKPPSFSTPTTARSKSMERRKSVGLPTHLNLQGSGYGFSKAGSHKFQTSKSQDAGSWLTLQELASAVLVALPCALASLVFEIGVVPQSSLYLERPTSLVESMLEEDIPKRLSEAENSPLALVCGLTSLTLTMVGLRGKFAQAIGSVARNPETSSTGSLPKDGYVQLSRRIAGRVLTVGLPFYAISHLGGARVATVTLVMLASSITATEDENRELSNIKGWKRLLSHRKWTVASVLLQMLCDLIGITNGTTILSIGLGYVSLSLAVFAMPPPYPSRTPQASMITSGDPLPETANWGVPPANQAKPSNITSISPLISTVGDINLTLGTGTMLGVLSYVFSHLNASSAGAVPIQELAWSVLSACTAALSLMLIDPTSLRNNRGLGSLLGSLGSGLLIMMFHYNVWKSLIYQSILISVSFAAIFFDTHKTLSKHSHSDHQHQAHHQSHTKDVAGSSKFTKYVLCKVEPWPLLHSIVAEKDSRRIFYFMWYVRHL